ncbi:hypothetical protein SeMB42_g03855 [Synchytrium endobioticum]|uniref:Ion transport domain-containing protein n=1 Tax=Synchytrium endobioticum TaxID=286115 RepID=A0A507D3X3_9FUNG|nr:hypothetical protein SeMB42_g03855 [Synchytrium endobioticum]
MATLPPRDVGIISELDHEPLQRGRLQDDKNGPQHHENSAHSKYSIPPSTSLKSLPSSPFMRSPPASFLHMRTLIPPPKADLPPSTPPTTPPLLPIPHTLSKKPSHTSIQSFLERINKVAEETQPTPEASQVSLQKTPDVKHTSEVKGVRIDVNDTVFPIAHDHHFKRPEHPFHPPSESSSDHSADTASCTGTATTSNSVQHWPQWRQNVHYFLHEKKRSASAWALYYFFLAILVTSLITLCIASVPSIANTRETRVVLFIIDAVCVAGFTAELLLDVIVMRSWRQMMSIMFFIDVAATLPFYVELVVSLALGKHDDIIDGLMGIAGISMIRVLRLFRVFRIFKVFSKSGKLRAMAAALGESFDGILALLFILPMLIIFFGTLVYFSEQTLENFVDGVWYYSDTGEKSPFQSIPDAFWMTMVTLTTVGYGDAVPRSLPGRIVMACTMISSLFVLAFPLTMITMQYSQVVHRFAEERRRRKLERQQRRSERERAKLENEAQEHLDGVHDRCINHVPTATVASSSSTSTAFRADAPTLISDVEAKVDLLNVIPSRVELRVVSWKLEHQDDTRQDTLVLRSVEELRREEHQGEKVTYGSVCQ